jgi:type IV fimbrial biogenesis protein FimT
MRHAGISLIEIVIALAVVGMLMVAGLPALSGMLANIRVRGAAEEVAGGLQLARAEAMKRNQNVTFRVDASDGAGWSVVQDSDQSVITGKPATAGGTIQLEGDLDTFARFSNLGLRTLPVGGDLTFAVTNPGAGDCQPAGPVRCMNVIVRVGGQTRLCDPLRPAGDPQSCVF